MTAQAVVLPPAVRRQEEEARRKIAELQQPPKPAPAAPSEPPAPPAPVAPEPEAPGAPAPGAEAEPIQTPPPEPTPAGEGDEAGEDAPPPEGETVPPARREDWKQKYLTLQGMHQADLIALRAQVRDRDHTIQLLHKPPEPPPPPKKRFSDEEEETFGKDLLQTSERIAGEVAGEQTEAATREIRASVGELSGAVEKLREERFLERLSTRVPHWLDINRSEAWLRWLGQRDPVSGFPRQVSLDAAVTAYDADWVILILERFQKDTPAASAGPGTRLARVPPLAGQVMPQRAPGPTPPPPTPKVWLTSEIKKITEDIVKRRYPPAKAQQLDKEINQAIREGRIKIG